LNMRNAGTLLMRKMFSAVLGLTILVSVNHGHASDAESRLIVPEPYRKFTLYTQEYGGLKPKVLVVFHGFASAMPNGAFKRLRKAVSEHYSVLGFNYDYFDHDANLAVFNQAWENVLKHHEVTFSGSSLGGFWANFYAQIFDVKRILLVNPVIEPHAQLQQFIGPVYVEKRGIELVVTQADIDTYEGLTSPSGGGVRRLILLTRDDKVIDYKRTVDHFTEEDDTLLIFDKGGHTLDLNKPRFRDPIIKFFIQD